MATEADTPQPVPLTERDGINVHLTAQEFNRPPEPIDNLLKSMHTQESSNHGDGAAHIDNEDVLGVSKGESFLESPLKTKVDSKETFGKREPCEAVEMPHEAEKHLQENEKQVQIDEHFDAAQETLSKENDAMAEIKGVQNVEENNEFVDSTEMVKIEEPEVKVQIPISSEEKMIQPVEETVNVNKKIEENTDDFENEEERTKRGVCAEVETSKEVGEPEGSLDQNTEVSAQSPDLTFDSANGGVQIITEACLKDGTENCAVGTEVTHIEENVSEQSSAGAEKKQPQSCSSLINEQCSETIRLIEKINTETESSNDSVVAESPGTHNDQIAISESKEAAQDALDLSSFTPAAESPAIEETDLTVHEIAKTSGVACTTESQETNMKDTSQIVEMQEKKDADVPVIEVEAPALQKVDNSVSEAIKREIPEIGISEMVEQPGETDKSEADKVKDEINPSGMFMKQEEGEKNIEVSAKEISGEEKDSGEDAVMESEINLSDAITTAAREENEVEIKEHEKNLHGSSTQKDELENEKIEKSMNVVTEGADTTCSGENVVAITCTEEEALIERKEESSEEKHGKEKPHDTDVTGDDGISDKRDVPPTELTKKIESAGVEISKDEANEFHRPQQLEHETTLVEDEKLEMVSGIQSQENVPGIQSQEDHCESSETCDGTKDKILDHSSEKRRITTELISNDAADNEKLEKVQELHTDEELVTDEKEINSNRVIIEEQVEKKEEAHEIQISKPETNDDNGKCKTGEVTSDEVIITAFVVESTEQSAQPADPQENAALRDEVKENEKVDDVKNEEVEDGHKISGIGKVTAEQSIEGDGTQSLAEPINEDTVKISQDTVEVAEMSGKEDIDKQITEEDVKGLSQESVEERLDKNFQDEQKCNDMSSGEVHEEAETAKTVDNISSDANQNDEIPASTLQTSLGKEEGSLQIKDVTPADPTASEAKGKDEALMIKDRESENNEMLAEVKDKKETESSKHEEVENTMQKNESVEYLEESTDMTSTGTEKDDSSKTAGTDRHELVESPQHNVKEEITENDEQIAEKSNSEILEPSENDENSNSDLEACLLKEQEILKYENLIPPEASATADEDGSSKTNDAIQIEVKKKNEESMEHEENLEQTQKNKQVENLEAPQSSETKKDVSDEITSNLEVETVEKELSDIKDDNTDFETVEEDRLDRKGVKIEVVEKDENDFRNDKAEAKTTEMEGLDKQADNAEVKTHEKYGVDKKEDIAEAEMVEENNLDKQDDEVEKTEKDATEVETVKENNLHKYTENAGVEIVEKDENKVEPVEGGDDKNPGNAELEMIEEDGVDKKTDDAEIDAVDGTRNEPKTNIGKQEDPKEQIIDDGTDSAPLECVEPSPVQDDQTDAKNAEDSNDKVVEPSKSAEKDENIADDANQKDEIPSTCISTSLVKEAERSQECKNDPPSQTSPDEKEEEDVSQIKMDEDNGSTAASAETNASVHEEASKGAGDIANDKNQNGESTNSNLQTSMAEEQGILESNNQAEAEASPAESKDEDQSYIKTDEDNENDAVVPEVKEERQEGKLKVEESIPTISNETKADASGKITGDVEVEKVETPENNEKDSEIAKEENTGGPHTPKNNIIPSEASDQQDPVNCQKDEQYSENSSGEILGEFETAIIGENVAHEKDQRDASPCTTLPSSSVEKEESPKHEDADATSADVSIYENREKDETPTKSGENNDSNAENIEGKEETSKGEEILEQEPEKKQMEVAEVTSKNEEKLEEELQKNEPEEPLGQSSNFVPVETDEDTLSEGATATRLGEVGAIPNVEGTIGEGRQEEEEETGNINAVTVEKAAMEEVSVGTISGTGEGIEKHVAMKEEETEINILPQPTERETSSTEAQDAVDAKNQAPEEENIVNDQSDIHTGEKINEDEMRNSASKQEVNEIIQGAEKDDNTGKQMTGEGNVIEEKGKEVIKETDEEESKEKEKENGCNMTETKEEVEESKSEATETIETSSSEEAKASETTEAKEGSKPLQSACTESIPEISSFKSEDKEEIIEKEETHLNDSSSLSVTEGTKEKGLNGSETGDKVQTERLVTSSEERGVKLNTKETWDCANTEVQLEEEMNGGENKDQEMLEAADKAKEDTDKLEEETNSERGGLATNSEPSSKEAVEMEKSEIEPDEGEIATKAEACPEETVQMNNAELEVDISNETVQMEEREIVFKEEISKGDSAIKAEVTSKEDAKMSATIESEIAISGEENSAREVEEASSNKVTTEPELAIFEGELARKPEASSKESIEVENKEIKPEEVISKEEDSDKKFEAEKFTVEPEMANFEAENPVTLVEVSSETATKVKKSESEPEVAVFKEGDSATKAEVALKEEVEAEKAAIQPEVVLSQEVDQMISLEASSEAAISEEGDLAAKVEASSEAVTKADKVETGTEVAVSEGDLNTKFEASTDAANEVEKADIEPEAAIPKEKDSATEFEVASEEDGAAQKSMTESEEAISEEVDSVTKVGGSTKEDDEVEKADIQPEGAISEERDSATEFKTASEEDVEAQKSTTEPEVATSEEVDSVISVGGSTKEADEVQKLDIEPEAAIAKEKDTATELQVPLEENAEVQKSTIVSEVAISEDVDPMTKVGGSTKEATEVEKHNIEPQEAISKERYSATELEAASENVEAQKSITESEVAISEEVDLITKVEGITNEANEGAISKESDSATEIKVASEEDIESQKSTAESEVAISEEVNSVKKVERRTNEADEVKKSNICEDDSEVEHEASPKDAAKVEKADIYGEQDSDTKMEESPKEDVEMEKVAVGPEVAIQEAGDLDAKVENIYAEVETEATEPEAAISAERDLVTAIEMSKVSIEVEKEATKAEEAICEAGDADTKLEDRSVEAVEVEKAPIELERRIPKVDSSGTDIHKTHTDTDVKSTEPGKKVDCNSDIVTRGQDNETVSETTQSEIEDNRNDDLDHSCESTEKQSLHEFQESRQDIQKKIEGTSDIADHVKETPQTDDTAEVAILNAEVRGDLDKTDDADQTHAKKLHSVDVPEERINEMKESSKECTENLDEMESHSNEIQKITETSSEEAPANDKQVQVPNVSSTSSSHSIEIEEIQQEKGLSDSASKLAADDDHRENVMEVKETRQENENADTVEENKKDSETVMESKHEELYTAETEAEIEVTEEEMTGKQHETPENTDADVAKESEGDSGEIREKTKEFSKEMHKSQDDDTITEKDIAIVKTIPEEVAKEQCGTQENADADEIKEREVDHNKAHEFQHRELHTANIGEQTEEVCKEISTSHYDETDLEHEATVTETTSEGKSRELFETPENEDTDKVAESKTNHELQTAEIGQVQEISQEISRSQDKEIDLENEATCVQVIRAEMTKEHETPKTAVVEERKNESHVVQEAQPQKQHTAVAGEEIKEVTEWVPKSQQDKPVASFEVAADETTRGLDTPENAGEVAERKMDSDISDECQKHEVYPAESGEADELTKSISKNQDDESITEKEVIFQQANPEEEAKDQQETPSLGLPSREEECKAQAAIEEIEHNKRKILSKVNEDPESSFEQKTTEETEEMSQEEPKELEDSKLEPELKTGEVYTENEEEEKTEQSLDETKEDLKQNFEETEPATEDKVATDQTVTEKVSEAQHKSSPDELVLKEQEHETWTVIEKPEQNIDETEVLKHMAKDTEESCLEEEECKKVEVTTKEAIETKVEAVQIINEDSESIPKNNSRDCGEVKDNKEHDEMAEISKGIQVDNPIENLTEKTAVSDKILDCKTETHEDTATFVSEFHSHGPIESEAETSKKILKAAATQLMTEENLSKKTIDETESTLNEVKEKQIELEKEGAKDCQSISHGEETTKDKHVELELKVEDSDVDQSTEKEKNIEEVHKETEETDAGKTMADNTEKRTVEQLHQAVTEDGSIKESIPDINDSKVEQEGTEEISVKERREDLGWKLSKEVATGITEENGTTRDTNQGEKTLSETPEKPIMKEAEPNRTTEVTTPTDGSIEITGKIEAIEESTESAEISLFDMMQRSTREKQATAQKNEPKDELKAETAEKTKSVEEKDEDEEDEGHRKDPGTDALVMVEATKDIDVKVSHKKSHNILSGVGSKVKHSISKVKKAITGKSSHSKQHSPKSGAKEQVNSGN